MMTVSRAIKNQAGVGSETRRRILCIAEELGYRPNPLVSALMAQLRAGRQGKYVANLAYINLYQDREFWSRTPTFTKFFNGAQRRAEMLGYGLEHFWLREPGMTSKRLSKILLGRGIHGVIVSPAPRGPGHFSFDWPRFAAVTQGFSLARPNLSRASNHFVHTMRLIYRKLHHLGRQRVALAITPEMSARSHDIMRAFTVLYQSAASTKDRVEPYFDGEIDPRRFVAWYKRRRPDVIITPFQDALEWLVEAGVRAPDDVSLVTPDWHAETTPDWAGVDQDLPAVGAAAVDLLVSQLMSNEYGIPKSPKTLLMEGNWVDGKTLA